MLEPMHSLVANYGIVEVYVQVRAEGPMEHIALSLQPIGGEAAKLQTKLKYFTL